MNILSLQDEELHASGFSEKRFSLQLWHERLGHVSHSTIQKMCNLNVVDVLKVTPSSTVQFCEGCVVDTIASIFLPADEIVQQKSASWYTQMYVAQ